MSKLTVKLGLRLYTGYDSWVTPIFAKKIVNFENTAKLVFRGHSRELENVAFMNSCPLYTGQNYIQYSLMGKMRMSFIDSDLLYRGVFLGWFDCTIN